MRPKRAPKSARCICRDMPLACIMRPPRFAHYTCRCGLSKARDARILYNPRAEHAVRSRGIRAYHKQARQAAEHAQSRTGVSRCGHCLGYRLTVTAQTPSLVTDAKEEFVIPRLRASTALAAGCKKLAPQALWKSATIRALYMPTRALKSAGRANSLQPPRGARSAKPGD